MKAYTRFANSLLFPLHERLKGHDTLSILKRIERSQWLPAAEIQALQAEALNFFIESAARHVPFYRNLFADRGLTPADFTSLDDLRHLPPINKDTIRQNWDRWTSARATGLSRHSTSGSSGEPLQFLLSKHRISFDIAAKWRATRWWGVDIGDREMVLWGSLLETAAQDRIRAIRDRLLRSRLVPARDLSLRRLDDILDEIQRFRPTMLFGYPSALSRIAFRARELGRNMGDLGIRVAFCTSEVLRPEWRAAIGEVFNCHVANEYGARDAGFIARECPHGNLHITAEEVIVEVVDEAGRPLPHGVEGDLLVTNLAGPEFPFIRYRTGDRGVLADKQCPCGRGLPIIERISGRANDGLIALDGSWVHGSAINHALREIPALEAYQVIQETQHLVRILLATKQPVSAAEADKLARHTRTLLGTALTVEIERVGEIQPASNGKFRHIICRIERPQPTPSKQTEIGE